MSASKRAQWLLAAGALSGIALAALDIARAPAKPDLPADAVAVVDGEPIGQGDYASALAAVAADRRDGADDPGVRRHVLKRLIDEELLVQTALELGLAHRDRRVRADLVSAAVGFLTETPVADPKDGELRSFFEQHAGYFARDPELELRELFFRAKAGDDSSARQRALEARALWTAPGASDTKARSGDPSPLPLPSGPLPVTKWEQYLGPAAMRAVAELPEGSVSEPITNADGTRLLRVVRRVGGNVPPLAEVRSAVLSEWRRRKSEQRLREFLDARRARANVVVQGDLGS
jgi:PPIC-type PPIASE domain/SurA-like N-terminal domain